MRIIFSLALTLTLAATSSQAQRMISGKVFDKNGTPLTGAQVALEQGQKGTMTDMHGQYALMVPDGHQFLHFSLDPAHQSPMVLLGKAPTLNAIILPIQSETGTQKSPTTTVVQFNKSAVQLTGIVRDQSGNPVKGVELRLSGNSGIHTTSDALGQFSLTVPAGSTNVLHIVQQGDNLRYTVQLADVQTLHLPIVFSIP